MTQDKFGQGMGIWHITTGGADFEIRPQMTDVRKLRALFFEEAQGKNVARLMEKLTTFLVEIFKRDCPDDPEERISEFVELNIVKLAPEALVKFRFLTQEQVDKGLGEEIKKLMMGN